MTNSNSCAIFISSLIEDTYFDQISANGTPEKTHSLFKECLSKITTTQDTLIRDENMSYVFMTSCIEGDYRLSLLVERDNMDAAIFDDFVETLAHLTPHLTPSLRIFCKFADGIRSKKTMDIALSSSRIGIVLVARSGELMLSNNIADEMLAEGGSLRISHGKIRAINAENTKLLMSEIERSAFSQTQIHDRHVYTPLAFPRQSSATPLTIIVRPGPAYHPIIHPMRRSALLVMRDPDALPLNSTTTVMQLFGLTTAEASVTAELARGANIEEIAAFFGTSRNTVRTQLKSVFNKMGINRQSDLVRIILNSGASST